MINPDDDPNEAYDIVPMTGGPEGWMTVQMNGIDVWHGPPEVADRFKNDPAFRLEIRSRKKAWELRG